MALTPFYYNNGSYWMQGVTTEGTGGVLPFKTGADIDGVHTIYWFKVPSKPSGTVYPTWDAGRIIGYGSKLMYTSTGQSSNGKYWMNTPSWTETYNVSVVMAGQIKLGIPKHSTVSGVLYDGNGSVSATYTHHDSTSKTSNTVNSGGTSNKTTEFYGKQGTKVTLTAVPSAGSSFMGWSTGLTTAPSVLTATMSFNVSDAATWYAFFKDTSCNVNFRTTGAYSISLYNGVATRGAVLTGSTSIPFEGAPPSSQAGVVITPTTNQYGEVSGFNWKFTVPDAANSDVALTTTALQHTRATTISIIPNNKGFFVSARFLGTDPSYQSDGAVLNTYPSKAIEFAPSRGAASNPAWSFLKWVIDGVNHTTETIITPPNATLATVALHLQELPFSTPAKLISNLVSYIAGNPAETAGNTLTIERLGDVVPDESDKVYVGYPVKITPVAVTGWSFKQLLLKKSGAVDVPIPMGEDGDAEVAYYGEGWTYLAVFEIEKIAVSAQGDGSGNVSTSLTSGSSTVEHGEVDYGSPVKFEASITGGLLDPTYSFAGWYVGDTLKSTDNPYQIDSLYAPLAIVGRMNIKITTGTVSGNGSVGVTGVDGSGKVLFGNEIELTATPDVGYVFMGWLDHNSNPYSDIQQNDTVVVGVDRHTFKANFVSKESLVQYYCAFLNFDEANYRKPWLGSLLVTGVGIEEIDSATFWANMPDGITETPIHMGDPEEDRPPPGDRFFKFTGMFNGSIQAFQATTKGLYSMQIMGVVPNDAVWTWGEPSLLSTGATASIYRPGIFLVTAIWGDDVKVTVNAAYATGSDQSMGDIGVSLSPTATEGDKTLLVPSGATVYLTATPKLGFKFKGWYDNAGMTSISGAPFIAYYERTWYAAFEPDTNLVYVFDRGATRMKGTYESRVFDAGAPIDMSSARLDADNYGSGNVVLTVKSGESPDLAEHVGKTIEISSQDPRRLPQGRRHRYQAVLVEFFSRIRRVTVSTSMRGLNG